MATFTNQAQVSYNGITRSSNITVGEITETLIVTKTPLSDTYTAGSVVTYVINIINSGSSGYTDVKLTDTLGATEFGTETIYPLSYNAGSVRVFVNGVLQPAPTVTSTQPLTITGLTVPAGATVTIIYEATVTSYAPLGTEGSITNDVTVDSTTTRADGCPAPFSLTATATITPALAPDLTISKSLNPTSVQESGQITYTFVIANYGNTAADAGDNVAVTDTFDPVLAGLSASLDGTPLALGTDYTYNTTTGEFATVAGRITVPAATTVQDPVTGEYTTTPGIATLVVTGTI